MSTLPRFVYGPLQAGTVTLFAQINGQFYVIRSDPNPQYPPYFGYADGSSNYLPFQFSSSGGTTTLRTSSGQGLTQGNDPEFPTLLTPSSGQFKYQYVDPIASGTPLMAGVLIQMIVGNYPLTFAWKSKDYETKDKQNATKSNYIPSYSGSINKIIIVPINAIPADNCNAISNNGPYVAYSNKTNPPIYFTTKDFCINKITNPPCPSDNVCGDSVNGTTCYGPCTSGSCNATAQGELKCTVIPPIIPPDNGGGGDNGDDTWKWILIIGAAIIGLILLILIIFFIVKASSTPKAPPRVPYSSDLYTYKEIMPQ